MPIFGRQSWGIGDLLSLLVFLAGSSDTAEINKVIVFAFFVICHLWSYGGLWLEI